MKKAVIITIIILVLLGVAAYVYVKLASQQVTIPEKVTKENQEKKLNAYLPDWLPGTYQIDKTSFSRQEGQVFVFSATDADKNRLFFSEQPIPKKFDFDRFYKTQVVDPVNLKDVPYESVYAKAPVGSTTILSIKTNDTWIMMSTNAPIDKVMAQKIVQEMKKY